MQQSDHAGPRVSRLATLFARTLATLFRWKVPPQFPNVPKAVFIASPHTTNWDGFYMVVTAWAMGVHLNWMTKHTLFRWPMGPIVRFFGAIPVDRTSRNDTVTQIAEQFAQRDGMYLAIAPSGTRKKRDHWKSGFYHIARKANVPILCGFLDYPRRTGGIGPTIDLTGDITHDMDRIRAFYDGISGLRPELHTRVQLREEKPDA